MPSFTSPFETIIRKPLTLVELRMRRYSGKIRCKPDWCKKVHDDAIVAKWREEILEHDAAMVEQYWGGDEYWNIGDYRNLKQWPRDKITDTQLNYIFDELRYEARQYEEETGIFVSSLAQLVTTAADLTTAYRPLRSTKCMSRGPSYPQISRSPSCRGSLR